MYDIIIVGAGPAGISAALTARSRGKSVLVISNPYRQSGLYKAKLVENYPGMPSVSGAQMLDTMFAQLQAAAAEVKTGRALGAMKMGDAFSVSVGQDYYQGSAIIIAAGIVQQSAYPGETEFLGRGVSYCATCDGMLFRNRSVAVIGLNDEAESEAEFLRSIGCKVEYFDRKRARKYEIRGDETVKVLIADGEEYPADCVFILRSTIAPTSFMPELEISGGHICASEDGKTNISGVFAAGDCIGKPYQAARAVGQGNTAALSACEYLDKR